MKLSNLKISLPNDFGIGSLTLFSFEKILITNEKKYGSLSNIYKYISKMKLFNLKISLSNDFGTGPLTLFSFEKKKKNSFARHSIFPIVYTWNRFIQ